MDTRPEYGGNYSLGFHSAPAAEVEAFFADADCSSESIEQILAELLILKITNEAGDPVEDIWLTIGGKHVSAIGIGDGFFIREIPSPFYGPYVLEADGRETTFESLPLTGVVNIIV